jgi:hypothetical protein
VKTRRKSEYKKERVKTRITRRGENITRSKEE